MEKVLIPKEFDEYINTKIKLGRRLGECTIGITNQFSTPLLYIKSNKKPFFGLVSMISGGYYYFDNLNKKESIILNKFMHSSPNFHNGDCTNWAFIFIQYLIDYYNLKDQSNDKIMYIYSKINLLNDDIIVPNFDNAYRYTNIIETDKFIDDIYNILIKEEEK